MELEDDLAFEEGVLLEDDMSLDMDCDDGVLKDMVRREKKICRLPKEDRSRENNIIRVSRAVLATAFQTHATPASNILRHSS